MNANNATVNQNVNNRTSNNSNVEINSPNTIDILAESISLDRAKNYFKNVEMNVEGKDIGKIIGKSISDSLSNLKEYFNTTEEDNDHQDEQLDSILEVLESDSESNKKREEVTRQDLEYSEKMYALEHEKHLYNLKRDEELERQAQEERHDDKVRRNEEQRAQENEEKMRHNSLLSALGGLGGNLSFDAKGMTDKIGELVKNARQASVESIKSNGLIPSLISGAFSTLLAGPLKALTSSLKIGVGALAKKIGVALAPALNAVLPKALQGSLGAVLGKTGLVLGVGALSYFLTKSFLESVGYYDWLDGLIEDFKKTEKGKEAEKKEAEAIKTNQEEGKSIDENIKKLAEADNKSVEQIRKLLLSDENDQGNLMAMTNYLDQLKNDRDRDKLLLASGILKSKNNRGIAQADMAEQANIAYSEEQKQTSKLNSALNFLNPASPFGGDIDFVGNTDPQGLKPWEFYNKKNKKVENKFTNPIDYKLHRGTDADMRRDKNLDRNIKTRLNGYIGNQYADELIKLANSLPQTMKKVEKESKTSDVTKTRKEAKKQEDKAQQIYMDHNEKMTNAIIKGFEELLKQGEISQELYDQQVKELKGINDKEFSPTIITETNGTPPIPTNKNRK